ESHALPERFLQQNTCAAISRSIRKVARCSPNPVFY
ncbi:hypothetical protein ECEC1869_3288, partial [Escherichia coli EC1869]